MTSLVKPHGGALVERVVSGRAARALATRARRLSTITLDEHTLARLDLLACGGAAPLRGFMTHSQYRSVLDRQRLPNGLLFPLPLVLPVRPGRLGASPPGSEVALRDASGALRGTLAVTDTFVRDSREEARLVHGTADPAHPAAAWLLGAPAGAVGGEVTLLRPEDASFETAREVRLRLAQQAFFRVAGGFGAGLPEIAPGEDARVDALLVRSIAGAVALDPHLPVVIARHLPFVAPQAGAREILFQALVLKNFGASHLVVPDAQRDLASADALMRTRFELGMTLQRGHDASRTGEPSMSRPAA
jgi:sulfate adenylyltransferase